MSDTDPVSTRAARMNIYQRLMQELDSSGAHYSRQLSDVDLSDPDDVKASVIDPAGTVLVHLGASNFLERFKLYVTHVQEWRTQFPNLKSVDLRYEHQVIVNPDMAANASTGGEARKPAAAPAEPKNAASADPAHPAQPSPAAKKPPVKHKTTKSHT